MYVSPVGGAVLCGFIVAAVVGMAVAKRATNRRIRSLSLAVVLMTLCQLCSIAVRYLDWKSIELATSIEVVQLTASALTLALVYLLYKENRDRSNADMRLRLLESDVASANFGTETRWDPSFKIEQPGTLQVLGLSNTFSRPVKSVDLSQSSVRVVGAEMIPNRATVQIDICGMQLSGKVVMCLPCAAGFTVCIMFNNWLEREVLDSMLHFEDYSILEKSPVPSAQN